MMEKVMILFMMFACVYAVVTEMRIRRWRKNMESVLKTFDLHTELLIRRLDILEEAVNTLLFKHGGEGMGGKVPDNLEAFGAIDPNAGVVAEIDLSKLERIIKNAPDVGAFTVKLKGEKFYNRCVLTLLDIEVEWGHDFKKGEAGTEKQR